MLINKEALSALRLVATLKPENCQDFLQYPDFKSQWRELRERGLIEVAVVQSGNDIILLIDCKMTKAGYQYLDNIE